MSYSRHGYSRWYIWWDTSSGDTLETQKLAIDDCCEVVYLDPVEVYQMIMRGHWKKFLPPTAFDDKGEPVERDHLTDCCVTWLEDVAREHSPDFNAAYHRLNVQWKLFEELRSARFGDEVRNDAQTAGDAAHEYSASKLREPSFARAMMENAEKLADELKRGVARALPVGNCARCGKDHDMLIFRRLTRPMAEEDGGWNFFATCPETKEPILLKDTE